MTGEPFQLALTKAEAVALHRASAFFADAFENAGIDLSEVEMPNGTVGVSPLVAGVMKLEAALIGEGVEL